MRNLDVLAARSLALLRSGRKLPLIALAVAVVLFSSLPALAFIPVLPAINTNNVIIITNAPYNAVGDGIFTNTAAIQLAITTASSGANVGGLSGGTVRVPGPGTYLCGPLTLANNVNLQLDDGAKILMLPFGKYPLTFTTNITATTTNILIAAANLINATSLHDISITGSGTIDGQGLPWWPYANSNNFTRPVMLRWSNCDRELIQNVTLSNSPEFHISIGGSAAETTVDHVTILANPSSDPQNPGHNTDACDVSGTDILVENSYISVGDDNFTCGGNTMNVLITNNTYGFGHGVSIGSFTSPSVSNITVINCTFNNTEQGVHIKSDRDRGGLVQDINYYNLSMTNVLRPIVIYCQYTNTTPAFSAVDSITPVVAAAYTSAPIGNTTPRYRNIIISNLTATVQPNRTAGLIWGLPEMCISNLTLIKIRITAPKTFGIYYAKGIILNDVQITTPNNVNNLSFYDAEITFTNAAPATNTLTLDGLTTNSIGTTLVLFNAKAWLRNTNAIDLVPLSLAASLLTISNHFNFNAAKTVNFTLGTNATTITVLSNLFLGGTINVFPGDGFTNTSYTLFTYKNLALGTPTLGNMPLGFAGTLDTNTFGQVNVNVQTQVLTTPAAPTNITAIGSNALVQLSWSPSLSTAGYVVKRSNTDGGPYLTTFSGITATNYTDALVTNGTTYYYVITATNSAGESTNSSQVSATPNPPALGSGGVFADTFASGSTLNSATPAPPTTGSAAYQIVSSKTWVPLPSLTSGHLSFGIATTSSGIIETEALLTNAFGLISIGDTLTLTVTFTDTSGILTQAGSLGFGLYDSGGNNPVPGGMNASLSPSLFDHATGNAQSWSGCVGQISFTGASSRIMTRAPQIGSDNNNQDLVTSGSGSSYANPIAATVGSQNTAGVTLTAGAQYTEVLQIIVTAPRTIGITNSLYLGGNTNGALVTQFGGESVGPDLLFTFDSLAIGWRATGNLSASVIDINQIKVDFADVFIPPPVPLLTPVTIASQIVNNQLQLTWPSDHIGWTLQIQTNSLDSGLGTNWQPVANSSTTNQVTIPLTPDNGAVFLRMTHP